jgi:hypothetical protein
LFDLHNNFDLVNIWYDLTSRQFTLSWVKKYGAWVKDDEADTIELIHKSVSYLRITDKDLDGRLEDDNSLDDLTYYPSTHRDDNESVVDRAEPEPEDDILYNFISGRQIRVCCDAIELALG